MTIQASLAKVQEQQPKMKMNLLRKNFNLSHAQFEQMVNDLRKGKEDLFEQMFVKHFASCRQYLIKNMGADAQTAYDVSMEALLDMRQGLIKGNLQYGNLKYMFTKMAIQNYGRWKQKETRDISHVPEGFEEEWPSFLEDQEMLSALDKAWSKMCQDCQKLLHAFYREKKNLKEISEQSNNKLSHSAMRKRKQRCMQELKTLFKGFYQ